MENDKLTRQRAELAALIGRHCLTNGAADTAVPGIKPFCEPTTDLPVLAQIIKHELRYPPGRDVAQFRQSQTT